MVKITAMTEPPIYREYSGVEFPPDFERVALRRGESSSPSAWPRASLPRSAPGPNSPPSRPSTTAIEHGCAGHPGRPHPSAWSWIGSFSKSASTIRGIHSRKLSKPSSGRYPRRGRPWRLPQATLMDSVEHRLKDGLHCVILRKEIGEKPTYLPKEIESASLLRGL